MFGYANRETEALMPAPIRYAHRLVEELARIRKQEDGVMDYLRPDSKSQVTMEYGEDRTRPERAHTVVVSTQHDEDVTIEQIKADLWEHLLPAVLPENLLDDDLILHVNPTGRFVIGGPHGDTGLTGRKIIVDTYGGRGSHGGGAFSGKDPSKVDRSATYAARHVAKNIVGAELADEALVQVAYAIGVADPVSIDVDTRGTGVMPDDRLAAVVEETFDLRPAALIERLDLLRPLYRPTAAYGHFGREGFAWEQLDYVDALQENAGQVA
jgi:S-adenosylmethionine synthetase